jgi:hypothetical protein
MPKIVSLLRKSLPSLMLVALGLAALPAHIVMAAGPGDSLPAGIGGLVAPRLERMFAYQQERYNHQSQLLERMPTFANRIQNLIDGATAKGYDTAALQTALDEFSAALPAAQAAHNLAGALITAHEGFDANGKVTDVAAAVKTVIGVHEDFASFVDTMLPPFLALREALRPFVSQNNLRGRLVPTATIAP